MYTADLHSESSAATSRSLSSQNLLAPIAQWLAEQLRGMVTASSYLADDKPPKTAHPIHTSHPNAECRSLYAFLDQTMPVRIPP